MRERGGGELPPPAGSAPADARQPFPSDQQITETLHNILLETNPNMFNLNVVVQQLEARLGHNLPHKLDFIRFRINHFFWQIQARALAQAQARAEAHLRPAPPQQQLQLQLQLQQQQQAQHNVAKDGFSLQQNRNYHFPPNFSFQHSVEYRVRPQSRAVLPHSVQQPQSPQTQLVSAAVETPKAGGQPVKKRRGGPGGLNKVCGVSPELQTIVGQPTMPRTEIVKQLWAYIKKNNLQDPNNKRKINCNDELRLLFETDCTDMFKMNKLLSKHILSLDSDQCSKKIKVDVESGSESSDSVPVVVISEVLANFLGTEERQMSQAEVLRQMWKYVSVNNLEDPANSMAIMCDEKLKGLLGCESISALGLPEMLSRRHLSNKS